MQGSGSPTLHSSLSPVHVFSSSASSHASLKKEEVASSSREPPPRRYIVSFRVLQENIHGIQNISKR